MSEQTKMQQVGKEILTRSAECERGVIVVREDGQAGIALVAPNSLMLATILAPGMDGVPVFDFWLN